ncbi:MAG: DUF4159 domain-containing protein [Phycisphaerae bacterium]|nr:DUF4159 domain-containing protein [Phycisphaerae bacterium]
MRKHPQARNAISGRWRALLSLLTVLVAGAIAPAVAVAAPRPVTDESVEDAIRRAVAFIKSQRNENGHWEASAAGSQFYGGDTGLALLALLYAGESPLQSDMDKSLGWLGELDLSETYTIGTRAHVFALVPGGKYRRILQHDVDWLTQNIASGESDHPGSYDYQEPGKRYDNSNSQYGVLGMWMASDAGVSVAGTYWELVAGHWLGDQNGDGGWGYGKRDGTTGSMTAAGLATMYVVLDRQYVGRPRDAAPIHGAIDRGLDWIGTHFTTDNPQGKAQWKYYYIYGIERVGRASGYKYFRNVDWFRTGAAELLDQQLPEGNWKGTGGGGSFDMSELRNTTFALMFLCHGRAPLLFNKLEHVIEPDKPAETAVATSEERVDSDWTMDRTPSKEPEPESESRRDQPSRRPRRPEPEPEFEGPIQDWNNKPRDVAGLTRYAQGSLERLLNWQIVRLEGPLEDLMEAPVLYMCGEMDWEFTDTEVQKLRDYCLRGGMILGVAHRGNPKFAEGFRKLAARAFPEYKFERLPPDHPLFSGDVRSAIEKPPELYQISGGLRTLMLLSPEDISEAWHKYQPRSREADFQLGANIFLYATDKTTQRSRLKTPFIAPIQTTIDREIVVARIKYNGRWNPEPYGWDRLACYMNNEAHTRLRVDNGITLDSPELLNYRVAHITGSDALELSEVERDGLHKFLTGGGTLIADATGGSREFTESLEAVLTGLFRKDPERLPENSALISGAGLPDGTSLKGTEYRRNARRESGGRDYPRLMVYKRASRLPVIYSPLDISTGLLGTDVYNCVGYEGESSMRIMRNLLLYGSLSSMEQARLERGH